MDVIVCTLLTVAVAVAVFFCLKCVSKRSSDKQDPDLGLSRFAAAVKHDPITIHPKHDHYPRQSTRTQIPSFSTENNVIYETSQSDLLVDESSVLYPDVSVKDFREKATYHHEERVWCFEMASNAYSYGDGAGAKFYSNKGHEHTRLMEEANEDALNLLIEQCEPALQQTNTLDLHGFFVNEGIDYLDEVIEEREEAFTRGLEYLTVIIGKGRHSDGRNKLRPALIDYLNDGRYEYTEETRGVFKFKLHPRNLQNVINTKPKNEHSHPMTRKVKQRYLENKKTPTSVKNRFNVFQDMDPN